MKPSSFSSLLLVLALLFAGTNLSGQAEMPRKSPKASASFTVGLVDVSIQYSAPAARDRAIWGNIVPYDKIWRAGANEATTVSFSTDVIVGNQPLTAGKYSIFLIPRATGAWTAIFNKNTDLWGEYGYDQSQDAIRTEARVREITDFAERLVYEIIDTRLDAGEIRLRWGKQMIVIPFRTFLEQQMKLAVENAAKTIDEADKWQVYAQAADYLMVSKDYLDQAMEFAKKSTAMSQHSWNTWIEAQVHAAKGDYIGAIATARKCADLAANETDGFYENSRDLINRTISAWEQALKN